MNEVDRGAYGQKLKLFQYIVRFLIIPICLAINHILNNPLSPAISNMRLQNVHCQGSMKNSSQ